MAASQVSKLGSVLLGGLLLGVFTVGALAEEIAPSTYSPYADRKYATQVYFGDTHLHTSFSADAGAFGNRLDINEAYKFARGDQVTSTTGQKAQLSRPLDFLVVTDHSDGMGFIPDLIAGTPNILAVPEGKDWHERINQGGESAVRCCAGNHRPVLSRKIARRIDLYAGHTGL